MVERQPEKLKVVGSSPISNIMLFMVLCLFILVLNSLLSIYIYTYVAYIFFVIYILVLLFKNLNLSILNQINV